MEEKVKLSTKILSLSFFTVLFNSSGFQTLMYTIPIYAIYIVVLLLEKKKSQEKLLLSKNSISLLAFLVVIIFNVFIVSFSSHAFNIMICYSITILMFLLIFTAKLSKYDVKYLLNSYILMDIFVVMKMLFQQIRRDGDIFRYTISYKGVTMDSNFLGATISFPTVYLMYRLFYNIGNRKKNLFLFLMCLLGIVFTGSRSAIIAMILAAIILYFSVLLSQKNKKKAMNFLKITIIAIIILIFIYNILPDVFINRYFRTSYVDGSNIERVRAWKVAIHLFLNSIIFGNGIDSGYNLGMSFGNTRHMYTHNSHLDLIADFGILGLLTFGFFVMKLLFRIVKTKNYLNLALLINTLFLASIISAMYSAFYWQNLILIYILQIHFEKNKEISL